jgi:cAMP-dependent protein kinase regulator
MTKRESILKQRACLRSPLAYLGTSSQSVEKDRPLKDFEAVARIRKAIRSQRAFECLSEEQLLQLQHKMREHRVQARSILVSQGEKSDDFFVVDTGELYGYLQIDPQKPSTHIKSYGPGDSFGELALVCNRRCTASIIARTSAVLWRIDRAVFSKVLCARGAETCC